MFALHVDPSFVVGGGVVVEQFNFGDDEFCCGCTFKSKLKFYRFPYRMYKALVLYGDEETYTSVK